MTLKTFAAAAVTGLALMAAPLAAQDKGTVGIAMPTKSSARWIDDGNNIILHVHPSISVVRSSDKIIKLGASQGGDITLPLASSTISSMFRVW